MVASMSDSHSASSDGIAALWRDVLALVRNRNFLFLLAAFSISTAMSWSLLTVQAQLIQPCVPGNASLSGISGAALLGVGVLASFVMGFVLQRTKAYTLTQKVFMAASAAASAFILAANRPGAETLILVSWCVLGAALMPVLPVTLELAAEITYPVSADNSASLLLTAANVASTGITFALSGLLEYQVSVDCSSIVTPAAGLILLSMVVGALIALPVRADYRRRNLEATTTGSAATADVVHHLPAALLPVSAPP